MRFFFILFSSALLATVNEPLRLEFFSGYRNDRIHWHLQESGNGGALTYSELYKNIEYWINGLVLKAIHRDLTFFLRGSYGAFGRGTVSQKLANLPQQPQFSFETEGWSGDGIGYFGYAVNLTTDRTYKVILTPLIGYSVYFEQLRRNNPTSALSEELSSSLPGVFRQVWNGFLFGGTLSVKPVGPLIFNIGYSYHLMHNRTRTQSQYSLEGISTEQSVKTSSGGDGGQTGWAQVDGLIGSCWRLGFGGEIHYFFTRVVDASISENHQESFPEKFKLRWIPISTWAQISRSF